MDVGTISKSLFLVRGELPTETLDDILALRQLSTSKKNEQRDYPGHTAASMGGEVEALVCSGLNRPYQVQTILLGDPREDEVVVRLVATGVCHTDFACTNVSCFSPHVWPWMVERCLSRVRLGLYLGLCLGSLWVLSGPSRSVPPRTVLLSSETVLTRLLQGSIPVPFPFVGGHEGAGIVEIVGSQVRHVQVGDHVLMTFSSCGRCVHCARDAPAYCTRMREYNFRGSRPEDGSTAFSLPGGQAVSSHFFGQSSFAAKAVVRARSVVKVEHDDSLPLEILCAFGCGVQTGAGTVLNVLKPELGSSVAVFGAGAVGMAGLMAARLTPATTIIAVDILDSKLDLALRLGATHVINPSRVNVVEEIRRLTGGRGVDRAFDATGRVAVIRDMLDCAGPGGLVVTVGAPAMEDGLEIKPATWLEKGVSYMGAHQGSSVPEKVYSHPRTPSFQIESIFLTAGIQFIPLLLQFYKTGRFPVDRIVKTYHYTEIERAHKDLVAGKCVKAVLRWSGCPDETAEKGQTDL